MGKRRFTKYKNGKILDDRTKLTWLVGPDKDTTYSQAKDFIESLGKGWRLPTRKEISEILTTKTDRRLPPSFNTTGWLLWTDEESHKERAEWRFGFLLSNAFYDSRCKGAGDRVFAVMGAKNEGRRKKDYARLHGK
jgi:hypothetical protein